METAMYNAMTRYNREKSKRIREKHANNIVRGFGIFAFFLVAMIVTKLYDPMGTSPMSRPVISICIFAMIASFALCVCPPSDDG